MADKLKGMLIAAAAVAVIAVGGTAIAGAQGGDKPAPAQENGETDDRDDARGERDEAAKGPGADRASAAALKAVGAGTVTEVEKADDGQSGFEVEIERPNGSSVEVQVGEDFKVGSVENDA